SSSRRNASMGVRTHLLFVAGTAGRTGFWNDHQLRRFPMKASSFGSIHALAAAENTIAATMAVRARCMEITFRQLSYKRRLGGAAMAELTWESGRREVMELA